MGKNCNVFCFKNNDSHHEVVIQISEIQDFKLNLNEVHTALKCALMRIGQMAANDGQGFDGEFEVPIEK